ncbi:hypothetical protein ACFSTC_21845 [Nonomuraea ferruginea]
MLLVCGALRDLFGIPFQDVAEVYQVPGVLPPPSTCWPRGWS